MQCSKCYYSAYTFNHSYLLHLLIQLASALFLQLFGICLYITQKTPQRSINVCRTKHIETLWHKFTKESKNPMKPLPVGSPSKSQSFYSTINIIISFKHKHVWFGMMCDFGADIEGLDSLHGDVARSVFIL